MLEQSFSWPSFIALILTSIILLAFFISLLLIFAGLFGIGISLIKNAPRAKWISVLKKGLFAFFTTLAFFFILNVSLNFLGLGSPYSSNSSFTGDTQVLTPSGKTKISDLKEGDRVLGLDTKEKALKTEVIEKHRSYPTNSYYIINDEIKVTSEHPFAVGNPNNITWKKVKDLSVGDRLITSEKESLLIESIKEVSLDKPVLVYNPQVSGNHNYFVVIGDKAVLAHNKLGGLENNDFEE